MFEKYKEAKEKRSHFGMSKREYYKLVFMGLIALGCLVVIILNWGALTGSVGTEVEIPSTPVPEGVTVKQMRADDPEAMKKFDELKEKLRQERLKTAGEVGELELPEIPKPPEEWKEDPDIWKQVNDSAVDVIEEQVMLYALHQLNSMSQEEINQKIQEDGNIPYSDFTENPSQFRGKFVEITGTLYLLENQVMSPNRSGLNQFWYGLIYNQQYRRYRRAYFYIFDKDREWMTHEEARAKGLTRNGDLVKIKGVFIKLYTNTTEKGVKMTYPFIIARKLEETRNVTVKEQYPWGMLWVVGVLFAAVFTIFFIVMRRDIKVDERFAHSRVHKKAKLVSNELARKLSNKPKSETKDDSDMPEAPNKPENTG